MIQSKPEYRCPLLVARSPAGDLQITSCSWQVPQLRAEIYATCTIVGVALPALSFLF